MRREESSNKKWIYFLIFCMVVLTVDLMNVNAMNVLRNSAKKLLNFPFHVQQLLRLFGKCPQHHRAKIVEENISGQV